jgi:predicted permease
VRRSLIVLVGAVGLVLLTACANVAGLLLARAVGRQQEIAVRVSIGATGRRIAAQVIAESVLLALAGGVLGVAIGALGLEAIRALGAASVPRLGEIELNLGVLAFTFVVSLVSGVLFGSVPALRLARMPLFATVKDGARRTSSGGRALVAAEIALSIVLLIAAGLLIRSFAHLQTIRPGFNASSTLTMELTMSGQKYAAAPEVYETYRRLWEGLAQLPGVEAAGGVSALPLSQMMAWGPITVEGRAMLPGEAFINVDQRMVGGDYFAAMQIPLVAGRLFDRHDTRESLRVVLVDEHMARQLWPDRDAVGKRVRVGGADSASPWLTVIGVVGRVKQDALDADSRMAMYFPHAQFTARAMNVVVRSAQEPAPLTSAVREALRAIDPELPMYGVRTMEDRVSASLAPRRFSVLLLTLFAIVAMGLAAIGVYSVLAYVVNQERRALGIRLALGATPHRVRLFILKQGLVVTAIGVAVGLAVSVPASRLLESLLFGVAPVDPVTFVTVPALLTVAALFAAYVPARRASRVDPMTSLRVE